MPLSAIDVFDTPFTLTLMALPSYAADYARYCQPP
jgi:hypothetical protein